MSGGSGESLQGLLDDYDGGAGTQRGGNMPGTSVDSAETIEVIENPWKVTVEGSAQSVFGAKAIGFWDSFSLHLNNLLGPSIVLLPLLNQEAGWIPVTIGLFLLAFFSALAAAMLADAIQRIPGNHEFQSRFEYGAVAHHYFGRTAGMCTHILFTLSLHATVIASMMISAQMLDALLSQTTGQTWGLQYQTWPPSFVTGSGDPAQPFGDTFFVLSAGLVISIALCVPLGLLNLQQSMKFQWFSAIMCFVVAAAFVVQFTLNINPYTFWHKASNGPQLTPAFNSVGLLRVTGLTAFSFTYAAFIPSWLAECSKDVSLTKSLWVPAGVSLVLKFLFGLLGAWAFPLYDQKSGKPLPGSENVLNFLAGDSMPHVIQVLAYVWIACNVIPRIPAMCIVIRYDIITSKIPGISRRAGSFVYSVILPWVIAAFLFQSNNLASFCNWTSIILQGVVNFMLPALIYHRALYYYPKSSDTSAQSDVTEAFKRHSDAILAAEALLPGMRAKRRAPTTRSLLHSRASLNADGKEMEDIRAIPRYWGVDQKRIARYIFAFCAIVWITTIVANFVHEACGSQGVTSKAFCASL